MRQRISSHRPGARGRGGFSMVELVVVMAIIAILAALSIPAVGRARQAARKIECINNLKNIALGLTLFDLVNKRLPASGSYQVNANGTHQLHSWAVEILPHIEQANLFNQINLDRRLSDPANDALRTAQIPSYVCPLDLTRNPEKHGDQSYAVNGGIGFTARVGGVRDCAIDRRRAILDLNGDGNGCSGNPTLDDLDKKLFKQLGLFFLESRNNNVTQRHHSIPDVRDGTSQTFLVGENVRTGFDPDGKFRNFADPNPFRSAFYIGDPCADGRCSDGNVDYSRCNSGESRINCGLWSAEGTSPVPNSFHEGGVNMAYADGHVKFLFETIDGKVYAALSSPQGMLLDGTPLAQSIVSGEGY